MQLICVAVIVSKGLNTISPCYVWFQSSLSSSRKVETFVTDHTQIFERFSVGEAVTIGWGRVSVMELKQKTSDFCVLTVRHVLIA
eukprot:605948-Pelagomonas_calceolata.AAC.1